MAPVGPQERFWDLKFDAASTSNHTSPASSTGTSPTRAYPARRLAKTPLSNGWQLPPAEFKFTPSDSPFNNPFSSTADRLPEDFTGRSSSPTILVASPVAQDPDASVAPAAPAHDRRHDERSPRGLPIRKRSTSIAFNPKVTLDCGHETAIDEPVPRPNRWSADSRPRGRSLLQELSTESHSQSSLHRAQSDSDRTNYDAVTGKLLLRRTREARRNDERGWLHLGEARRPLLQSALEGLARDGDALGRERVASLTSDSTASPVIDEAPTPTEPPPGFTLSPTAGPSSLRQPTSLETSSAWPMPRALDSSSRARSFNIERSGSLRRNRKAVSRRSSQASSFLSTFGTRSAPTAEPDDEGQEVCEYVMGKQIGYGGFSVVKQAFTIEDGRQVTRAVKIVRKRIPGKTDRENEQAQAEFEHEVSVWRVLNHRSILPLVAVYDTPFATYCFMPLNEAGSLYDLIRARRGGLPAGLARRYAFQLASALRYLHEDVRIAHRDIKLENCLLDRSGDGSCDGNILLCDFGMAEYINHEGSSFGRGGSPDPYERATDRPPAKNIGPSSSSAQLSSTSTSIDGSLHYAPPELILSQAALYSAAVDLWAFGIVVHALLAGKLPFQHTFLPKLQMMILKGEWADEPLRDAVGAGADGEGAVELVKGCLDMNPATRWSVRQVLQSRWLQGCDAMGGAELEGAWGL
ncbi:MAG: hypothetical protein M1832_004221 [Thelocarpon impressellum]|nr:MAG: hypothetical protein M1832_004221 [Thelocarpon impressellum]